MWIESSNWFNTYFILQSTVVKMLRKKKRDVTPELYWQCVGAFREHNHGLVQDSQFSFCMVENSCCCVSSHAGQFKINIKKTKQKRINIALVIKLSN